MKQQIMEKLFSEKPLTNEEILHIGSCLSDDEKPKEGTKRRSKKSKILPYDHTIRESLSKACYLTDKDFDNINTLIRSEVIDRKDELDTSSKVVEVYEKIGLAKPQNFRLLMYQYVKMKEQLENKRASNSIGFRGDLGDFLNFLKNGGEGL